MRYHLRTLLRTWYTATPLVIIGVFLLVAIGGNLAAWTNPIYPMYFQGSDIIVGASFLSLLPALLFALLVGAPLFAEDLRYNAPLFYFSRPLRPGTYFRGKLFFLAGVLLAISFVPVALLLLLGLLIRVGPQSGIEYHNEIATGTDALHALTVAIPGLLVMLLWITAIVLVVSAHTRRTWHAAMGFAIIVGAWSLLGTSASILADSSLKFIWGPIGWLTLLFELPFQVYYHDRIRYLGPDGRHYTPPPPEHYAQLGLSMTLVYALMLGTSILALWLTHRRLHRLEALL